MSKVKIPQCVDAESACEIIESTIDEMELLTRAFDVISEVVNQRPAKASVESDTDRIVLN